MHKHFHILGKYMGDDNILLSVRQQETKSIPVKLFTVPLSPMWMRMFAHTHSAESVGNWIITGIVFPAAPEHTIVTVIADTEMEDLLVPIAGSEYDGLVPNWE